MTITKKTIEALARFDTPTICNVVELYEVVPRNRGYMDGRIRAAFPELPPMVGFAATAAFRSDAPPAAGDAYASMEQQVERFADLPGPPVIVFQDLDNPPISATFGEVMCASYQAFGAVGLITSGAGRDLQQVHALRFPVFTGGTICSHGYCHILHVGLPVHVGGLTLANGDLLHGDVNGVTRIPSNIADQIPEVAAEFIAAEKALIDFTRLPGPKSKSAWVELRKEFSASISRLSKRIKQGV